MAAGSKGFQKGHQINVGVKSPNWKADSASKSAMHKWIDTWKGKPSSCEMCGTTSAKKFEWANKDHSYRRILDDYIRMCTSCHRKYDIQFNGYGKKTKGKDSDK